MNPAATTDSPFAGWRIVVENTFADPGGGWRELLHMMAGASSTTVETFGAGPPSEEVQALVALWPAADRNKTNTDAIRISAVFAGATATTGLPPDRGASTVVYFLPGELDAARACLRRINDGRIVSLHTLPELQAGHLVAADPATSSRFLFFPPIARGAHPPEVSSNRFSGGIVTRSAGVQGDSALARLASVLEEAGIIPVLRWPVKPGEQTFAHDTRWKILLHDPAEAHAAAVAATAAGATAMFPLNGNDAVRRTASVGVIGQPTPAADETRIRILMSGWFTPHSPPAKHTELQRAFSPRGAAQRLHDWLAPSSSVARGESDGFLFPHDLTTADAAPPASVAELAHVFLAMLEPWLHAFRPRGACHQHLQLLRDALRTDDSVETVPANAEIRELLDNTPLSSADIASLAEKAGERPKGVLALMRLLGRNHALDLAERIASDLPSGTRRGFLTHTASIALRSTSSLYDANTRVAHAPLVSRCATLIDDEIERGWGDDCSPQILAEALALAGDPAAARECVMAARATSGPTPPLASFLACQFWCLELDRETRELAAVDDDASFANPVEKWVRGLALAFSGRGREAAGFWEEVADAWPAFFGDQPPAAPDSWFLHTAALALTGDASQSAEFAAFTRGRDPLAELKLSALARRLSLRPASPRVTLPRFRAPAVAPLYGFQGWERRHPAGGQP